ncbi:unnamed protein product [Microthlaspi erraticum]|uniref:Uncharacterized protein n=1 Tax=Microthlaspi erraticum TaxID=1685480 RepID=A0A6D2HQD2_9BRAS|nr:unnamed protein product [Microthlaspi erraticum]
MDLGGGSRDLISGLPDPLISHILSFLTTKEAASMSVLSSKWRYLFAFVTNLDFDASVYLTPREEIKIPVRIDGIMEMITQRKSSVPTSFMDFVDRVLALQDNSPVHKFSLKIRDGDDPVDPIRIFRWILNVLERGVADLKLGLDLERDLTQGIESDSLLPSEIFLSETLVRLKLSGCGPNIDVEEACLPKLKTLCIEGVHFEKHGVGLDKLLSGCHELEDLVLDDISWFIWDFASVSVPTLKRLKFSWQELDKNPKSVVGHS